MFTDWKEQTQIIKQAFGKLAQTHPKMFQAMGALNNASAAEGLDHKTHELIALAVAITTRCESCISLHAEAAVRAGATDNEIAGALATAIETNTSTAYAYALRAFEAVETQR